MTTCGMPLWACCNWACSNATVFWVSAVAASSSSFLLRIRMSLSSSSADCSRAFSAAWASSAACIAPSFASSWRARSACSRRRSPRRRGGASSSSGAPSRCSRPTWPCDSRATRSGGSGGVRRRSRAETPFSGGGGPLRLGSSWRSMTQETTGPSRPLSSMQTMSTSRRYSSLYLKRRQRERVISKYK